jgi:DNA helicase-2/ATP-dependent DNA helicase PcrA
MNITFNKNQLDAINHKDGPLMVLAGPGSGKTTVLVNRLKVLIEEYGVSPSEICVNTFTRAATEEMESRFQMLTGNKYHVYFCTIHSLCRRILMKYFGYEKENFINEGKKMDILINLTRENRLSIEKPDEFAKNAGQMISYNKNMYDQPNRYSGFEIERKKAVFIYNEYCGYMNEHQLLDFDDCLTRCYEHLKKNPEALSSIQEIYRYYLVDEFQDVNYLQANIIYLLSEKDRNLCIVGDDDQSMYKFRGARPEIMLNFEKKFPDCKKVMLNINYRSSKTIVEITGEMIKKNENRYQKDLESYRDDEILIHTQQLEDEGKQGDYIAQQIEQLFDKGIPYSEMSVLYRTKKDSAYVISALLKNNIPFIVRSSDSLDIHGHMICKDVINFFMIINGRTKSYQNMLRAMKRPTRYIPNSISSQCRSVDELIQYSDKIKKTYIKKNIDMFFSEIEELRSLNDFHEQFFYIMNVMGYENSIMKYFEDRPSKVLEGLQVLCMLKEEIRDFQTFDEWKTYVDDCEVKLKEITEQNEDSVVLQTIHTSKGLEYQAVFIINVNEDNIPFKFKEGAYQDIEEERRILYVGMTRAKDYLYLTAPNIVNEKIKNPSSFYYDVCRISQNETEKDPVFTDKNDENILLDMTAEETELIEETWDNNQKHDKNIIKPITNIRISDKDNYRELFRSIRSSPAVL